MRRILGSIVLIVTLLVLFYGKSNAQEGKILFECGEDVIEFPAYLCHISPFIREMIPTPLRPYQFVSFRHDADVGYLRILSELVANLPKAARDVAGNPVDRSTIDDNTIFVTSLVRKHLLWSLMNGVHTLHRERRIGCMSSLIPMRRSSVELSPRRSYTHPVLSSPRGGNNSSSFLNGVITPRRGYALKNSRNTNIGVNQILSGLYILSLDLEIKPITNFIAEIIIARLCHESSENLASLQGMLKTSGFGLFLDRELFYLKKHFALSELGKPEYTIADYIGLHGEPTLSAYRTIDLSSQELTSLYGLHFLSNPDGVESLSLHHNHFLGVDLDPDFPLAPFKRFSNLKYVFLYHNTLTHLPNTFLDGVELEVLEIQGNYLQGCDAVFSKWESVVKECCLVPQESSASRTFGWR